MSYILDALRKAERERRLARVPTLDTVHTLDKKPRARVAAWLITLLLVVNVGVLVWAFRWPLPDGAAPEGPPAVRVAPGAAPERRAEPASRPAAAPPPAEPRPGRETASSAPAPRSQPAPTTQAPAPSAPIPPPPPAPTPPAASPASPPVAAAPAAGLSAPPPAVPLPPPSAAPASPAAPPPVIDSAPAREAAAGLREAVRGLSLDVLVYADATAQRMVFINGRKYVEGQQVDGKLVVEAITPEGAVLVYEGQRHLLRPRSNPYVR